MTVLKIHFLNVGHGDCTFVEFPSGRLAMIDVNNTTSIPEEDLAALKNSFYRDHLAEAVVMKLEGRSWEDHYRDKMDDPLEYHRDVLGGRTIFRYIQTHPDMDHMTGFHKFFRDGGVALKNLWDVNHSKSLDKQDFENTKYEYVDWAQYLIRREGKPQAGGSLTVLNVAPGSDGDYWTEDGITILSPTAALVQECDDADAWNNMSYVLRIDYAGRRVVLPGDACGQAWDDIMSRWGEADLDCDVLKAAHHGRESGFHNDAVTAMNPGVVICSVGQEPDTDASDEYGNKGAEVLSTRYHGTITVTIDDHGDLKVESADSGAQLATIAS